MEAHEKKYIFFSKLTFLIFSKHFTWFVPISHEGGVLYILLQINWLSAID